MEPGILLYVEDSLPVSITETLTINDIDDTELTSAAVRITGGYEAGEDRLAFTGFAGITGNWNPATATLTLTGAAPTADYQNALRRVTYENLSDPPSTAVREVSFLADDGEATSNSVNRSIRVSPVNDAPTAVNDQYHVRQEQTLTVGPANGILANDFDPDSGNLVITLVSPPTHGTLLPDPDGAFAYQPSPGFFGIDEFRYRLHDGSEPSEIATVKIAVIPIFRPPVDDPDAPGPDADDDGPQDESGELTDDGEGSAITLPPPQSSNNDDESNTTNENSVATRIQENLEVQTTLAISRIDFSTQDDTRELIDFDFTLPEEGPLRATIREIAAGILDDSSSRTGAFDNIELSRRLEDLQEELGLDLSFPEWAAGGAAFSTFGFSAGYVLWSIRGGYMMASLLTSLPAWAVVDPLPVLEYIDDDESL